MDYQQLLSTFCKNSNSKYDNFNNKIINSGVPTLGCTVPFVRSVAKAYLTELDQVVALPIHRYYEVDLFKGMVVSAAKLPFEQKHRYLTEFADTIENWAVCDSNTVKVAKAELNKYFEYFCLLCQSDKPFVCRYGIVNLISNYLNERYIDEVFATLSQITTFGHYYVDMAVAWLVATAMAKCRDKTVQYLLGDARTVLTPFVYNKSLQKMRDSFRISNADKQWTETIKMM